MALPKVTFDFAGSGQDQSKGTRHLPLGAFATLQNTRQLKTGQLRKRRAFHRQTVSLSNQTTESVTNGTVFDGLGYAGGGLFRDNVDNFWALTSDRTSAYWRGRLPRLHPTLRAVGHTDNKTHKALAVLVGTDVWAFSLGDSGVNFSLDQQYRRIHMSVYDAASGVRRAGPVGFAGFIQATNYCAVYDGSRYIWLFTVNAGRFVTSVKIDSLSPTTAPTYAAYYDGGADFVANCVDAVKIGSAIYVVVTSYNSGAAKGLKTRHSILDQGTGAETAGAVESASYVPANQAITCQINNGPSFLEAQPGAGHGFGYYAFWTIGSTDSKAALKLIKFNLTTLAVSSTTVIGTEFNAAVLGTAHAGLVSGFYDSADGHCVTFSYVYRNLDPTYQIGITRHEVTPGGATNTTDVIAYGAALASKPFRDTTSGKWYLLTQFDDTEDKNLQRAWHVRQADRTGPLVRNIVSQVGWGRGSAAHHMWQTDTTGWTTSLLTQSTPFCPAVGLLSGKFYAGIELGDSAYKTAPQLLILDTAPAYSPPANIGGNLLVYPGGVPQIVGPADMCRDLAILMGPTVAPTQGSAGTGTDLDPVLVTYCYRMTTADGRITRSPFYPEPASLVYKDGGTPTLVLQPLWHIGRDGAGAEVEVWATVPGGVNLHLQFIFPNVPDATTLTLAIDPEAWTELGEPQPVSLVATPPPPCRVVAPFKDRLFISGTDTDGELWYSQPFEEGLGVELNSEGLRQVLRGSAVNAAAPIDWNSFALFRRNGITIIQGNGPGGDGGAYETVDVHTAQGVEKSATTGQVVVPTSRGIFFQGAGDGRVQLLTAGLQVVEGGQPVDTVALGALLTAGLEVVSDGATWLQFSDGTTVAIDQRNPTQVAPMGELGAYHVWTSTALTAASAYSVGLVDAGGTPIWLSAAGHIRRPKVSGDSNQWQDDGSSAADVLTKWRTGKVAPAGSQVEVLVSEVELLGTHVGASSCRLTVINDDDTSETHDVTSSSPVNYSARPGNCLRTQEVEVQFEELTSSTEGPVFDGFSVEFRPQGTKRLATGRVI